MYYLYLFTTILVTFGPWHVGEVLSGHVGFVFPWGTIVRGTVLPSFYNFIFSQFHLWAFHQPLLWALVFKTSMSLRVYETSDSKIILAITDIPVTIVLSLQAILLIVLYYFHSSLEICREIAIMLAPMEIVTIMIGFILNGIVSFHIRQMQLNK